MPIETYPEIISMVKTKLAATVATDKDNKTYTHYSMRRALKEVGCSESQIQGVLQYCANHGFDYCLDPTISATHFDPNNPNAVKDMVTDYPPSFACEWGADQLLSRLWALRS